MVKPPPTLSCIERCIVDLDSVNSSAFREQKPNFVSQTFTVTLIGSTSEFIAQYWVSHSIGSKSLNLRKKADVKFNNLFL